LKIITAYKSGGIYEEHHIERLREQVLIHSGLPLEVVYGEFPHWWCKISIFRIKGPVLYFDLDTTLIGDISDLIEIAKTRRFVALDDFNYRNFVQSAVLSWNGDMSHLHKAFAKDPEGYMREYPGGDQDFIRDHESPELWQKLLPENTIQSYKVHIRRRFVHENCRVVCYHGQPKGWTINPKTGAEYDAELVGVKK